MLGLVTLVLAATALFGVSSATATNTQLCSTDPLVSCTAVAHVHEATLNGAKAKIAFPNILTVECDVLFLSTAVGALGAPQRVEGNFTYTCANGCTVEEENGPSVIELLKTGHEVADATVTFLIHAKCIALNCSYLSIVTGSAVGSLLSNETNGEILIPTQGLLRESGLFCPANAFLTSVTTPLSKTYIGS